MTTPTPRFPFTEIIKWAANQAQFFAALGMELDRVRLDIEQKEQRIEMQNQELDRWRDPLVQQLEKSLWLTDGHEEPPAPPPPKSDMRGHWVYRDGKVQRVE